MLNLNENYFSISERRRRYHQTKFRLTPWNGRVFLRWLMVRELKG